MAWVLFYNVTKSNIEGYAEYEEMAKLVDARFGQRVYSCNVSQNIYEIVEEMTNLMLNSKLYY